MPTLFLIIGLPGSGKTTLARRIERERRALRLTPDEWMEPLYGTAMDQAELERRRTPVESMQWSVAARALELGVDVVLDWGLWSRRERDEMRAAQRRRGPGSSCNFSMSRARCSGRASQPGTPICRRVRFISLRRSSTCGRAGSSPRRPMS